MTGFSAGLKLSGVDDFITPSQACVLPLIGDNEKEEDVGVAMHLKAVTKEEKVKLDLADCLACSGCVTTAETILMEEQSVATVLAEVAKKGDRKFVMTLSPQAIASVAARYGCTSIEAYSRLVTLFKEHLHFDVVMDLIWAQAVSVIETTQEAVSRLRSRTNLPLITSACPGLVCYAEKKEKKLLNHLSGSQSAQAVAGKVLKTYFGEKWGKGAAEIYHVSMQPCYDKKLEATRKELRDVDGVRYTDIVVASHELVDVLSEVGVEWDALAAASTPWSSHVGGEIMKLVSESGQDPFLEGSGGYAGIVMMEVARMQGLELNVNAVQQGGKGEGWEVVCNKKRKGLTELTLKIGGDVAFKAALAYGFTQITNLVKVNRLRPVPPFMNYDFIELMACPEGCVNGGGQLKAVNDEKNAALVGRVRKLYHTLVHSHPADTPQDVLTTSALYDYLSGSPGSASAKAFLHTTYNDLNPPEGTAPAPTLAQMSW